MFIALLLIGLALFALHSQTQMALAPPTPPIVPTPTATASPTPPLPTATLLPTPSPSLPTATIPPTRVVPPITPTPEISGYLAYTVAPNDTLEQIAAAAGSDPALIRDYNRLKQPPPVGRPLIVPQLAGRSITLSSELINVQRGNNDRPWIALTLDGGANAAPVPSMLQTLRDRNITITFFVTSQFIRENPDLIRQIVADGHELANHSATHPDFTLLGDQQIREELLDPERVLAEVAPGASMRPFFRPPFGAYNARVLQLVQATGYLSIYWTLDSLDSIGEPKSAEFLFERMTNRLTPEQLRGAIILAHCGNQTTADALPAVLDRYRELGFEVRKLSEVLGGSLP
jgi:peptidoglycan/xylan/chitin deacetylase (PgdA/CDA1 family)